MKKRRNSKIYDHSETKAAAGSNKVKKENREDMGGKQAS